MAPSSALALTLALGAAAGPIAAPPPPPQAHAQLLKGPDRRPTDRLSGAQRAALRWWQEIGGDDLPVDERRQRADALRALWEEGDRRDEALRAQLERMELGWLMARARGTRDLALVAQAYYDLQEAGILDPFDWIDDAGDWNRAWIRSVDDLLYCRRNNCFCFVNLCAWLAGDQPVSAAGVPLISHGAWMHEASPGAHPLDGPPAVGEVVVNHHAFAVNNNIYGFQHTGIVVADGEVVHLGSRDLRKDPVDHVFARMTAVLWVGPFDWEGFTTSGR